jgi:hypothetical protein
MAYRNGVSRLCRFWPHPSCRRGVSTGELLALPSSVLIEKRKNVSIDLRVMFTIQVAAWYIGPRIGRFAKKDVVGSLDVTVVQVFTCDVHVIACMTIREGGVKMCPLPRASKNCCLCWQLYGWMARGYTFNTDRGCNVTCSNLADSFHFLHTTWTHSPAIHKTDFHEL